MTIILRGHFALKAKLVHSILTYTIETKKSCLSCCGKNFCRANELVQFVVEHGLWTTNVGINQRKLKIWADVADKICFGHT